MEGEEFKLGVNQVKETVANFCKTPDGKHAISNSGFLNDFELLNKIHKQIRQLQKLISNGYPSFPKLDNVDDALAQIKISGSAISVENLAVLRKWLQTGMEWLEFLKKNAEPELKVLVNHVSVNGDALRKINAIIDVDGNFRDDASPLLNKISSDLRNLSKKQQSLLDKIYKDALMKGFVPEGGSISVKNGRTVIPVLSRHKRNMGGILQDESTTGSVLFFEPTESVEISNLILEKENERKRETHRILLEISTFLNQDFEGLKRFRKFVGTLDQTLAKVKFANTFNLNIPQLQNISSTKIVEGYHPILKWNFDKQGKKTESLTINFDAECRIVLISGPNAGGKSVSIKTVGILQFMVQIGLPIPAHETSVFGVFNKIFVVIGDEQSIENDLSTYSSHLLNLKRVLKKANESSLVLIDEFGSGTEPVIGGAIAEAILKKLIVTNAKCLITTHYLNLKEFADREKGITNASMRFDMNKLEPLYKLEIGKPGGSFALEMMQKVGISHEIIVEAKKIAGEEVIGIEKLLAKVQRQKKNLETRESNIKYLEAELTVKNQKLESLQNKLDKQKDQIIKKAEETAKELLKDANKEIEKTIRHIKESKANKTETRKVRLSFNKFRDKVSSTLADEVNFVPKEPSEELKKGDYAILKGQSHPGIIEQIKGNKITLVVNGVSLKVDKDKLEKVSGKSARQQTRKYNRHIDTTSRKASFSPYLDVRGLRAEEAISLVDKFLDDAILVGESNLTILHGKGDGILKDLVRNQLKKLKYIDSFGDGDPDRGGAGLTVIQLK